MLADAVRARAARGHLEEHALAPVGALAARQPAVAGLLHHVRTAPTSSEEFVLSPWKPFAQEL